MILLFYKTHLPALLIIVFFCSVVFSAPEGYSQGFYKVTDKIGGSGSSTGQNGGTSDNSSALIIVGAAVIAGFLVYKLVLDKDKPEKDTTSSKETLIFKGINERTNIKNEETDKFQQVPINFYAGLQYPDGLLPERKVIVGFIYNF